MTATVTAVVPRSLIVPGLQPSARVSDASSAFRYRTAPVTRVEETPVLGELARLLAR